MIAPNETPPITSLDAFPFWPALVLCATLEDVRKMNLIFDMCRRHHVLPPVKVEIGTAFSMATPGVPRMFQTEGEVPDMWRTKVLID